MLYYNKVILTPILTLLVIMSPFQLDMYAWKLYMLLLHTNSMKKSIPNYKYLLLKQTLRILSFLILGIILKMPTFYDE